MLTFGFSIVFVVWCAHWILRSGCRRMDCCVRESIKTEFRLLGQVVVCVSERFMNLL